MVEFFDPDRSDEDFKFLLQLRINLTIELKIKGSGIMSSKKRTKPNIVFILSDDQGEWAMGCSGNREIQTPNLDKLASAGIRFKNFFCTSPVCSPSRASLLTGRIPSKHGVLDWIRRGNTGDTAREYLAGQTAYTDILAANGYKCGISGKWHLGHSFKPQKSFTHWFVHQRGGGPYNNAPMIRDGKPVNEAGYITEIVTDDAISFIEECVDGETPFYLSVNYTAPHAPWINQHPKEYVDLYKDCLFESCPQEAEHPWWNREDMLNDKSNPIEELKGYFASITAMDFHIGRIIDKLDNLGLREDTLICFMSDNGFNCGHHGIWGKGNGTFPLNMYDSSIRIPAIINHPGIITNNQICDVMLSGYDFIPTLLEYLDLSNTEADKLPGKSFFNLLFGDSIRENEHIVVFDEYGPVRMVRTKEWKYVHRYPYGPHELYDLSNDPSEKYNLIDDQGKLKIISDLKMILYDWFLKYVDPRFDGTHESVKGIGQIDLIGTSNKGRFSFIQDMKATGDSD